MKPTYRVYLAVILAVAAICVLVPPAVAGCPDNDPTCKLQPPESREVRVSTSDGDLVLSELDGSNPLAPLPMPPPALLKPVSAVVDSGSLTLEFSTIALPLRNQAEGDVSCGVQALGMALDGITGSAPTSNAILGFLQDEGMMYNFGTGVEELAHAAQNFGYTGSLPFHGWSLDQLSAALAGGKPVVVALGANGEDQPGHFVTVTGVSPDGKWVSYNDPTLGRQVISTEDFMRLWALQGTSGVSVANAAPAGESGTYAPWVALAAGLMALVSTTPMALQRKGIGGMLIATGGGGGSSAPPYAVPAGYRWKKNLVTKYKTIWEQDGWVYENKTVPRYEKQRVQVGTTTTYDKIPRYKTVRVQEGWDSVEKVVPKMVRKKVQVGTTTVYDKIPRYKTVRVQDGWNYIPERVPVYKNQRYVKYYRTTRQRKARYRYSYGRRIFAGYTYVTKRTPVYGTRRVRSGWTTRTKRVPRYVNKRQFAGYDVKATEVPKYEWRMVQDGYSVTHERVPHMVEKRVFDRYEFIPQVVPKYEWRHVRVGWTTEKERVPHMVQKQVPAGTQVKWELEMLTAPPTTPTPIPERPPTPEPSGTPEPSIVVRTNSENNDSLGSDDAQDPLGHFVDQLPNAFISLLRDKDFSKFLQEVKGLPDATVALPMLKGFGMDEITGPLVKHIDSDYAFRAFGRLIGDPLFGPIALTAGYGITLYPELKENYQSGAPPAEYVADAIIDSAGFGVSEVAGSAVGLVTIETGLGALAAKLAVDAGVGVAYDMAVDEFGWRESLTNWIQTYGDQDGAPQELPIQPQPIPEAPMIVPPAQEIINDDADLLISQSETPTPSQNTGQNLITPIVTQTPMPPDTPRIC